MILVTGGTGFIGRVLVRQLTEAGYPVRVLLRPSKKNPAIPKGVGVEAVVCSLNDDRNMRAALKDIDVVYHLASAERGGSRAELLRVDIQGTQNLVKIAAEVGVRRFFYLSHLGADRSSAFPVMKTKGIAEHFIRDSGMPYTIFRSAVVYGKGDRFTTGLGLLAKIFPLLFFLPGDGETLVQPIWVEDLAACMSWALEDIDINYQVIEIGGLETFMLRQVIELVLDAMGIKRILVKISPSVLRSLTVFFEYTLPRFPTSVFWMDYLAVNRTCLTDTLPRVFHLMPARFHKQIGYLREEEWGRKLWQTFFGRHR